MRNFKVITFLLILSMFLSFSLTATAATSEDYRNVDTSLKVYDYADLLTDQQEKTVKDRILKLIDKYDYDIFIVTIDYNDISYSTSDPSMSFIEDFGDYNGFGIAHGNDPDWGMDYVALLIDEDNETIWMDVKGKKCMGIYTDDIQDVILDNAFNYYVNYENYRTVDSFINSIERYGNKNSHETIYDENSVVYGNENKASKFIFSLFKAIFISAIITTITVIVVLKREHKLVSIGRTADQYSNGSLNLKNSKDTFIRHYTTKVRVNNDSHSGGGHSGGTHSHSSHSGSHHSGGGRHR